MIQMKHIFIWMVFHWCCFESEAKGKSETAYILFHLRRGKLCFICIRFSDVLKHDFSVSFKNCVYLLTFVRNQSTSCSKYWTTQYLIDYLQRELNYCSWCPLYSVLTEFCLRVYTFRQLSICLAKNKTKTNPSFNFAILWFKKELLKRDKREHPPPRYLYLHAFHFFISICPRLPTRLFRRETLIKQGD